MSRWGFVRPAVWRDAVWGLTRDAVITILALIVGAAWLFVTIASVFTKDYTPLVTVTPALMVIASGLLALAGKSSRNGRGNGASKDH